MPRRTTVFVLALTLVFQVLTLAAHTAHAALGTVGSGFTVTAGDLNFILKQIKIAERHTTTLTASNPCGTLLNQPGDGIPDAEQVPDIITSYGLRTVDGSCNNLKNASTYNFAAADQVFPRLTAPSFRDVPPDPSFPVPSVPSYRLPGNVVDSQPRTVSNLIDDQTDTNPAAVAAAGFPVRAQAKQGASAIPCAAGSTTTPVGCTPSHKTLFIPNITTDVGLSPPFNSIFTFFGQFFDHGVDQTVKTGATVFVPLKADDPLITLGPDGVAGTGDEVPPSQAFMVLTRAQVLPGPDGVLGTADDGPANTDTPWVDQSQTYASHASHQVFLREYVATTAATVGANSPAAVSTGKLLTGLPAGQTYPGSPDMTDGESTWASVKLQAAQKLGLLLKDTDVTNIPMLATDPYGKYLPGPARGLPQYVTATGLVEGNLAAPVPVPANTLHFNTPFVTDIAHNADPSPQAGPGTCNCTPVPDPDTTVQTNFLLQDPTTYDDELLNSHAACGDGRCNENIALTSIHSIFHSEHNRLVDDIQNTLNDPANAALKAAYQAPGVGGANGTGRYGYGERLFQAARFVTEMEYQHLVFEEFARKVQPAVRPFHVYSPDINAAIEAEFAHAVYRFGHSMLDDTVARTAADGTDHSLPLLTAFLNPPALYDSGTAATPLTAQAGAGQVLMGSSNQTGNEIDEFVTETLRNNLLGLPLDLPTINMARAREAGVAPLNGLRREIYSQTNDSQLQPYTSWSDYGQHLKHPESLVNFVAAYGLHPSITSQSTIAGKRAAALAIVDPPAGVTPPADAADFMFSTGAWANTAAGVTTTGLDDVDLWVGGLAEVTNLFGGLLGSTFNYVFQTQLEKLQDGDRFYYLARTPGLNLRTQLEGNSFSELIQRNTTGTDSMKADAFATADCKFQLADITAYSGAPTASASLVPPIPPLTTAGAVNDDPKTTDCDENQLLLMKPDGTVQYRAINNIDPSGINGQSVYNGTDGVDRINGGDDVALGGEGNDIITDLDGADVLKGGPGNDAMDAGPGDDIMMGGDGSDFLNGGANDNETFAGPGNDFINAGQGADAVFGDGGDDWIEGGTGQDLLQGDHGAPFFDDPGELAPGNDVFIGQPGENDYDAEGGDDLMMQNSAIDRNAGAGGFDWAFHTSCSTQPMAPPSQCETTPVNDDMMINNNLGGLPIQVIVNRDRWQETEADSGGDGNDVIKGQDGVLSTPRLVGGTGFQGCDAIDQAGLNRITGLAAILPPVTAWLGSATQTTSLSASGSCPLGSPVTPTNPNGDKVWGEGDILTGGMGSDTITGRSGDDVIDGDRFLTTGISVRTNPADPTTQIGRANSMEDKASTGTFGTGTAGMTLQQAVFAGLVDPGNLVIYRELVKPTVPAGDCGSLAPVNCDTAVFAGPLSQYTFSANANGSLNVTDTTSAAPAVGVVATGDGTDTLFNIEQLQFSDQTIAAPALPDAPTIGTATAAATSATVLWTPAPTATASGVSSYDVQVNSGGAVVRTITGLSRTATSTVVNGLTPGTTYTFQVRAVNLVGAGPYSAPSNAVTATAPITRPAAPTVVTATRGAASGTVDLAWTPGATGGSPITGSTILVRIGGATVRTIVLTTPVTSTTVTGLTNGTTYTFSVASRNSVGLGAARISNPVVPATVPGAPVIGLASSGAPGNPITVVATWSAPGSNGGLAVSGFRVTAIRLNANGTLSAVTLSRTVGAGVRSVGITVPAGNYRLRVTASNGVGTGASSAMSNAVAAR